MITILLTTTRRDDGHFGIAEPAPIAEVQFPNHACVPPVDGTIMIGNGQCLDGAPNNADGSTIRRFTVRQRIDDQHQRRHRHRLRDVGWPTDHDHLNRIDSKETR